MRWWRTLLFDAICIRAGTTAHANRTARTADEDEQQRGNDTTFEEVVLNTEYARKYKKRLFKYSDAL